MTNEVVIIVGVVGLACWVAALWVGRLDKRAQERYDRQQQLSREWWRERRK